MFGRLMQIRFFVPHARWHFGYFPTADFPRLAMTPESCFQFMVHLILKFEGCQQRILLWQGLHCRILPVIPYCSGIAKGVRFANEIFLRCLMRELGPQICPNFLLWETPAYTHYGARMCLLVAWAIINFGNQTPRSVQGSALGWSEKVPAHFVSQTSQMKCWA